MDGPTAVPTILKDDLLDVPIILEDDLLAAVMVATNITNDSKVGNLTNLDSFYFYEAEQLTFLCVMFAVIVCANSLLLVSLVSAKSRKSRTNFFIMHLALADLSVGLISVVTDIVWKITVEWYADGITCKIVKYLQVLVTFSSTYVLVALSIDRCDAIIHPMRFIGSWRRARMLVVCAWTVSALFSSPMLVLYDAAIHGGMNQCWINLGEPDSVAWRLYLLLISLTLFIIPAIIIISCYSVILWTLWSKGRMLKTPADADDRRLTGVDNKHVRARRENCDLRRASSRGLIPKAKIKTVKMTFVIVFVFIICWSPYIVFDLLQVFGHLPHTQTMIAVATFIQSLAPLNSAANPIIYIIFSNNVCRNLRRVPAVDWLVRRQVAWCPTSGSAAASTPTATSTFRYGTDFTNSSESRCRSANVRSAMQRSGTGRNYSAVTSGHFAETCHKAGATSAALDRIPAANGCARV